MFWPLASNKKNNTHPVNNGEVKQKKQFGNKPSKVFFFPNFRSRGIINHIKLVESWNLPPLVAHLFSIKFVQLPSLKLTFITHENQWLVQILDPFGAWLGLFSGANLLASFQGGFLNPALGSSFCSTLKRYNSCSSSWRLVVVVVGSSSHCDGTETSQIDGNWYQRW